MISRFDGEHAFLSNFHQCTLVVDEISFTSAEHAYQAMKTQDILEKRAIMEASTPGKAKRLGAKLTLPTDWNEVRVDTMRHVVTSKFTQNPQLMASLLSTNTHDLVEGNYWHDNFWGNCGCMRCTSIPGLNHLGRILMEVRTQLEDSNDTR